MPVFIILTKVIRGKVPKSNAWRITDLPYVQGWAGRAGTRQRGAWQKCKNRTHSEWGGNGWVVVRDKCYTCFAHKYVSRCVQPISRHRLSSPLLSPLVEENGGREQVVVHFSSSHPVHWSGSLHIHYMAMVCLSSYITVCHSQVFILSVSHIINCLSSSVCSITHILILHNCSCPVQLVSSTVCLGLTRHKVPGLHYTLSVLIGLFTFCPFIHCQGSTTHIIFIQYCHVNWYIYCPY